MSKWALAIGLGVLAHFAASFLVPLEVKDQSAMAGVLRWVWPWGMGDAGLLGRLSPGVMPLAGFWIAMAAAVLCGMAALAVLGWWVPTGWWQGLAVAGAALLVLLMVGFFGPTKILPIAAALAAIWAATGGASAFRLV